MRNSRPRPIAVFAVILVALVVHACKVLTVDEVRLDPVAFNPVGGTTITGVAGAVVPNAARVQVLDEDGEGLPGQTVTFTASGGTVSQASAVTDAQGQATVSWTLPTAAGPHTLTASVQGANLGNVVFNATVSPGPPAAIAIVTETPSSNGQTALVGSTVAVAPGVVVRDAFGNAVGAGTSVTFTVGAGGGTVRSSATSAEVTTVAVTTATNGVARLFSWRLGQVGANTLAARLTATPAVSTSFTATGTDPCSGLPIVLGNSVSGQLVTSDCAFAGGFVVDLFNFTVPSGTTQFLSATLTSSAFGPRLRGLFWIDSHLFTTSASPGTVTVHALLAAGSYRLGAGADQPAGSGGLGAYQLSTAANPADPGGCGNFFVTKGITVQHALVSTGCTYVKASQAGTVSSRIYQFFLPANETMTVRMNRGTLLDPYLEAYDFTSGSNVLVAFNDDIDGTNPSSVMVIPASTTGRFMFVRATHFYESATGADSGTYTLIIDP